MKRLDKGNKSFIFPSKQHLLQMDYSNEFREEEQLIAKTIEKFVEEQVNPNLDKLEAYDYEVAKELFRSTGDLGLLGADVPEAYGGLEMGKRTAGLIAEKMGYGSSFSVSFNIHTGVGTLPFVYFGTEQQKKRYLPKLTTGEWVGAYALTEPNAGSDALHAKTTAKKTNGKWVLNGEKQWITNAHIASVYVVFANTTEGITTFIVERDQPGVSIGPEEKKLGIKGSSTATLILEDVELTEEDILGEIGKGHRIALNILNLARLKLAFANIGTSKQSLAIAVQYGKERKQFNQEIVQFGMIQEKLANMAVAIYGAESTAYYTASILDGINVESPSQIVQVLANYAMDCSINKVKASETLDYCIDEAVQIHGGYGYMQEYEVERIYRDSRINRIFEGTNEINRLTITKSFLKQYVNAPELMGQSEKINNVFIRYSHQLLNSIMNALTKRFDLTKLNQFYLHGLANILEELYVIKAGEIAVNADKQPLTVKLFDVLCEEGYMRIENQAIVLLSSIYGLENSSKQEMIQGIRSLPVMYSNLFEKKQEIANEIIAKSGYFQ